MNVAWVRVRRVKTCIRNRSLASIVPHKTRSRPHGSNTRDVDDRTTTSLFHGGDRDPHAQKDALDIDGHDPIKLVFRDFERGFILVRCASVVDEDVQPAELRHCEVDHLAPVASRRNIGSDERDMAICGLGVGFL